MTHMRPIDVLFSLDHGPVSGVLNLLCATSLPPAHRPKVVEAPPWLVRRMEALRQRPRPTLERVLAQMRASLEAKRSETGRNATPETVKKLNIGLNP